MEPNEISDLMKKVKEDMAAIKMLGIDQKYPVTINNVIFRPPFCLGDSGIKPGTFVSVRPVQKEHEKKTFLGIYLGDLLTQMDQAVGFDTRTKELIVVATKTNPAIFVPDLGRVVWGYESWWGVIESPEQLREITDEDIQNVWYVKAMEQMAKKEGGE